ncbi:MAG TPA: hypothetical protein H9987_05950 [Candidatus Luteococcus avicola]|nr:hypothetical protein [Candidatus Luteococcus avicola]
MSPLRVVIPFAQVDKDQNPNARKASAEAQQEAYARAIAVTFASVRRWNPDAILTLATNGEAHPLTTQVFVDCNVEVDRFDFEHTVPKGFMPTFAGCLFIFDALARYADQDALYLDPDILCVGALDPLVAGCATGVSALPMSFPHTETVNGVLHEDARQILRDLGVDHFEGFFGGEAYFVPATLGRDFFDRSERIFRGSVRQFEQGRPHLVTEEHMLSGVVSRMPHVSMAPWARRIWTASRYRTVLGDERDLLLWHLPAEKDTGFAGLFETVADRTSWFWTAPREEYLNRSAKAMSIRHRTLKKVLRDVLGRTARSLGR